MLSANMINILKDSKKRNGRVIKLYKQEIKKLPKESKERQYMVNVNLLLLSENDDIDDMLKRYNDVASRKRKKVLGVY